MTKDSFELHVQKVLKTGPTVDEHAPGNTGEDKEKNNCLEETSCKSADTSGKPCFLIILFYIFLVSLVHGRGFFCKLCPIFFINQINTSRNSN